jgi:preprotein translocase subunit SecA
MGALAIGRDMLAEMATGEGKTLTVGLAGVMAGLSGRPCHVITANDYLAERDAKEMGPIYTLLGLTVGCIKQKMEDGPRTEQYRCDVTYGTASEFGFDFLFGTKLMRYVGGVIGLAIGYAIKYQLDKRYVFVGDGSPTS